MQAHETGKHGQPQCWQRKNRCGVTRHTQHHSEAFEWITLDDAHGIAPSSYSCAAAAAAAVSLIPVVLLLVMCWGLVACHSCPGS